MSSHGGKREGAGRKAVEKKTANLCGVRATPTELAAFKAAAVFYDTTLSEWVMLELRHAVKIAGLRAAMSTDGRDYVNANIAALAGEIGVIDKPKKSKGKK